MMSMTSSSPVGFVITQPFAHSPPPVPTFIPIEEEEPSDGGIAP